MAATSISRPGEAPPNKILQYFDVRLTRDSVADTTTVTATAVPRLPVDVYALR